MMIDHLGVLISCAPSNPRYSFSGCIVLADCMKMLHVRVEWMPAEGRELYWKEHVEAHPKNLALFR
jgi:hypothetical protein